MRIERVAPAERPAEDAGEDPAEAPADAPADAPAGDGAGDTGHRDVLTGLYEIARACDQPGPVMSLRHFAVSAVRGEDGEPAETWAARDDGQVVGGFVLSLPRTDNTHLAGLRLMTHPARRREGIGGALLDQAIGRARELGRRVLVAEAAAEGPGTAFAKARGFCLAATETRLVFDLRTADWSGLELLRARTVHHARDYSLERWAGPAPDDLLGDVAHLTAGMNDEPLGDLAMEGRRWTAERVRARDEMLARAGLRTYTMIARHTASGRPAGFTQLVVDAELPEGWGRQSATTVLAPHRGRRLGLVLKLANLMWFRACEPSAERVITWNSTENRHMLAINEALGFRAFDIRNQWQLDI